MWSGPESILGLLVGFPFYIHSHQWFASTNSPWNYFNRSDWCAWSDFPPHLLTLPCMLKLPFLELGAQKNSTPACLILSVASLLPKTYLLGYKISLRHFKLAGVNWYGASDSYHVVPCQQDGSIQLIGDFAGLESCRRFYRTTVWWNHLTWPRTIELQGGCLTLIVRLVALMSVHFQLLGSDLRGWNILRTLGKLLNIEPLTEVFFLGDEGGLLSCFILIKLTCVCTELHMFVSMFVYCLRRCIS